MSSLLQALHQKPSQVNPRLSFGSWQVDSVVLSSFIPNTIPNTIDQCNTHFTAYEVA